MTVKPRASKTSEQEKSNQWFHNNHPVKNRRMNSDSVLRIARRFKIEQQITKIETLPSGNINNTYRVFTEDQRGDVILQRINREVFQRPDLIMENIQTVRHHLNRFPVSGFTTNDRRWEMPRIYQTNDGANLVVDSQSFSWRALSYIRDSKSIDKITTPQQAEEMGFALGTFHRSTHTLNIATLHDTLSGFHLTSQYLSRFNTVLSRMPHQPQSPEDRFCATFIKKREKKVSILENALKKKKLLLRPTHGDPKISNVLFDKKTDSAISIIDLDTLRPGLIHHDIGDCLRSCCNEAGEEETRPEKVRFNIEICAIILKNYLSITSELWRPAELNYIYDSIHLMALELGIRFYTDFLEDNRYFKTEYDQQNLNRAIVQFRLTEEIEKREANIRAISSLM